MARNKKPRNGGKNDSGEPNYSLHPDVKKIILIIVFIALAALFILAALSQAGPAGILFYNTFRKLFGWGYYLFPAISFLLAFSLVATERRRVFGLTLISAFVFLISGLGFIDIISPGKGGLTGALIGSLKSPFGATASLIITFTALLISFLVVLNRPLKFSLPKMQKSEPQIKEPELNVSASAAAVVEETPKTETPKM